ncbi:hypothetical protein P7C70_g7168, partial [Phenoliferia sp. Uapishka_3]
MDTLFAAKPFPKVHSLSLTHIPYDYNWSSLASVFPSLSTLRIYLRYDLGASDGFFVRLGVAATPKLQVLAIEGQYELETWCEELGVMLQFPTCAGLRRLELPDVPRAGFELKGCEKAGLELLKECEKRSIVVVCKSGVLMLGRKLTLTITEEFQHPVEPLKCHVKRLAVLVVSDIDTIISGASTKKDLFRAFFHSSCNTLDQLHISFYDSDGQSSNVNAFLSSDIFPNLRRLSFDCIPSDYNFPASFSRTFPSLVDLSITTHLGVDAETERFYTSLARGIPFSIQTFTIEPRFLFNEWCDKLLNMIRQPSFRGLRRLNLPEVVADEFSLSDGVMGVEVGDDMTGFQLIKECQGRGIVLHCESGELTLEKMLTGPKEGGKLSVWEFSI